MVFQPVMDCHLRAYTVGWMVEQAEEASFVAQTIHLAVTFLDRYLSVTEVTREQIHDLAPACLLLPAKLKCHCDGKSCFSEVKYTISGKRISPWVSKAIFLSMISKGLHENIEN